MTDDKVPQPARHQDRRYRMPAGEHRGRINHHQQRNNDNSIGIMGTINGNGGNNHHHPYQAQNQDYNGHFSQIHHNQQYNQQFNQNHNQQYNQHHELSSNQFQFANAGQNMEWDANGATMYPNGYQQIANTQYHYAQVNNAGFTQPIIPSAAYAFNNQIPVMNQSMNQSMSQSMSQGMSQNMSQSQMARFPIVAASTFVPNHPQNHDGQGSYGPRAGSYHHPGPQTHQGQPNQFMNVPVSGPGQMPYGQVYPTHPVHQNTHHYNISPVARGAGIAGGAMGGAMVAIPGSQPAAAPYPQHAGQPYAHPNAPPIAHSAPRRNNGRYRAPGAQSRARPGAQAAAQPTAQPQAKPDAQPNTQYAAQAAAQHAGQPSSAQAVPVQLVVDQSPVHAPSAPPSSSQSEISPPPTPLPSHQGFQRVLAAARQALLDQMNQTTDTKLGPCRMLLPWLSRPEEDFPTRSSQSKGVKSPIILDKQRVSLPPDWPEMVVNPGDLVIANTAAHNTGTPDTVVYCGEAAELEHSRKQSIISVDASECSGVSGTPEVTPADSVAGLETVALPLDSAAPATPVASSPPKPKPATPKKSPKKSPKKPLEKSPKKAQDQKKQPDEITPVVPKPAPGAGPAAKTGAVTETARPGSADASAAASVIVSTAASDAGGPETDRASTAPSTPVKAPLWSKLFATSTSNPPSKSGPNGSAAGGKAVNGTASGSSGAANGTGSFCQANANGLGEACRSFKYESDGPLVLLEPRGLINTGNMCYMNSVLQVLIFCPPFYDFLDQVSKRVAHSFKSSTPLIDAMIMFMREYSVIKSAPSARQLQVNMKKEEFDRRGEPFTPEFVYEAMRQLPRFKDMTRGHQQDAEEFLGLLFQTLDDECVLSMASCGLSNEDGTGSDAPTDQWLEVGRKQRAVVTRSSGHSVSTPITKIFGGLIRSEFRVLGVKDSITEEPFQPLQLDIGGPEVNNVVDAFRALTRPERISGDFKSPRGIQSQATKQVLIDSLPPVLILHLKRFQFDPEANGTVKIWKKIGYPLNLEIPRDVLSRQTRQALGESALPQYRLISVVYHHGNNASGGHYTVDVRRQDGQEWIRLDDTAIGRVRPEDIAEVGCEPSPKNGQKNNGAPGDEDGWKQVAPAGAKKQWSSVVNGTASSAPSKESRAKENMKDNKVAYLLFYQRV